MPSVPNGARASGGHDQRISSSAPHDDPYIEDDQSEERSHSGSDDYDSQESFARQWAPPDVRMQARDEGTAKPIFIAKRHITCGNPAPVTPGNEKKPPHWRLNAQQRLKTMQAALILCLNIGCDPPDIVKTSPCSVLECWVDPYSMPPSKALETIGRNLQRQFEILNAKGKYKSYLDPSVEDFKHYMVTLRARTKEERALMYYNGHGVPKPTSNGEFWVFNANYTQYIPVSLNDFQDWIGSPSIFVWDCSAAGNILINYQKFAEPKDEHMRQMYPDGKFPPEYTPLMDCLQLLACGATETLPMAPDLPADIFTACLTSPIEMAVRFYILENRHRLPEELTLDMVMKIPGSLKDRRSPLGELHWIFTAVTDTIAWSTFTNENFRRLFRQDLITASLFRNFLLAERVMRNYACTPHTYPALPPTHTHKMWIAWDHAVDVCLSRLLDYMASIPALVESPPLVEGMAPPPPAEDPPLPDWPANPFFEEHLTAFQVWLNRGSSPVEDAGMRYQPTATRSGEGSRGFMYHPSEAQQNTPRRPPYQLPVLLQVLLSQAHRLRALILLAQFVDLGPWAVHLALEIGIFPYVQRLLQSPAPDVKPLLIFIWARIFAVDPSCQVDLLTAIGFRYFQGVLSPQQANTPTIASASEHRAMCAFILAKVARDHPSGQTAMFADGVFEQAVHRLDDQDFFLRQWSALCIAMMWDAKDDIKANGIESGVHDNLMEMLHDMSPEVRAAAMYALGTLLGASGSANDTRHGGGGTGGLLPFELRDQFRIEVAIGTRAMLAGRDDASPLVRKELIVLLSALVVEWRGWFVVAAWIYWEWDRGNRAGDPTIKGQLDIDNYGDGDDINTVIAHWIQYASVHDPRLGSDRGPIQDENRVLLSSFFTILTALFDLSVDSYPEVAAMARMVLDYILGYLRESAFAKLPNSTLSIFPIGLGEDSPRSSLAVSSRASTPAPRSRVPSLQMSSLSPAVMADLQSAIPYRTASLHRSESFNSGTTMNNDLRRTSSITASLRNLATGLAPSEPTSPRTPVSGSFAHVIDGLPGSPYVPTPHVVTIGYVPPWKASASLIPLPSPVNSSPRLHQRLPQTKHPNGIKLSPSWASLSPPNPALSSPMLTFPKKDLRGSSHLNDNKYHNGNGNEPSDTLADDFMFTAFDVIRALVGEDFVRQKARKLQYAQTHGYGRDLPPDPVFSSRLTLSRIDTVADLLPLRSTFFDSCAEYFSEPQMKRPDDAEPGSTAYSIQMAKRLADDQQISEATHAARVADFCPWDRGISAFNTGAPVTKLAMHTSAPHLLAADDTSTITTWDWSRKKRMSVFSNTNPSGSTITSLGFINEDTSTMVMAGSSDGVVRIYRNYADQEEEPIELVTSWRALNDRVRVNRGSGLVLNWQQDNALLLASGDVHSVRVWDAHRELCIQEIPTSASSSVTSLTSDPAAGALFAAAHADGSLHIFDRRRPPGNGQGSSSAVVFRECDGHRSWIRGVHWQRRGGQSLVSASVDGTVCVWDLRHDKPAVEMRPQDSGRGNLGAFAMHDEANVIVSTSAVSASSWRQQTISVDAIRLYDTGSEAPSLTRLTHQTGLAHPPASPLTTPSPVVFHPYKMVFAAGSADGMVRLYGAKTEGVRPKPTSPPTYAHLDNQDTG